MTKNILINVLLSKILQKSQLWEIQNAINKKPWKLLKDCQLLRGLNQPKIQKFRENYAKVKLKIKILRKTIFRKKSYKKQTKNK